MHFIENTRLFTLLFFVLAVVLYANTLGHQFVLDDEVVLSKNQYVQQGVKGIADILSHDTLSGYGRVGEGASLLEGGRFRPLSLIMFALLFSSAGAQPFIYHLACVLLYALSCVVLYRILLLILEGNLQRNWIAFLATAIFLVHPVHTEVVANIKSCDEQLALLFGLSAIYSVFKWKDDKKWPWSVLAGFFFLLACLGKENAITLVAVIPLALYFFRAYKPVQIVLSMVPVVVALLLFLGMRYATLGDGTGGTVMHDPLNNPFVTWVVDKWEPVPVIQQIATVLYSFGNYVRLLVFPYPLTHNYYPFHINVQDFSSPLVLLSTGLLIAALIYSIISIRKKSIAGFGILFFLITLSITLNVFFPVGTLMAERFLYLPSVGFTLSVGSLLAIGIHKRGNKLLLIFSAVIIALFAGLTIVRNGAWKNNETLLRTDLKASYGSVKLRNDLGALVLTRALETQDTSQKRVLLEEAYNHLKFAADSHRTFYDAYLAYGAASFYLHKYEESVFAYGTAFNLYPQSPQSRTGLVYALQWHGFDVGKKGEKEEAIAILTESWNLLPDINTALEISRLHSDLDHHDESLKWLEEAFMLTPNDESLKKRLYDAYIKAGRVAKADSLNNLAKRPQSGFLQGN